VVFAEYAEDVARACRERGVMTVAVTAGYIADEARPEFFRDMDAANVDLKAFKDESYQRLCFGRLQPVLDTLVYLHRETSVWLEVTTLLIPGENDARDEIERASDWFADNLGPEVPWHFTAFHPDFKMLRAAPTPAATLSRARDIARSRGLKYVYTGNVYDRAGGSTWCPSCGALLIERQWHELGAYHMDRNRCDACGCAIAGRFESHPGTWGRRRQPVRLR
jgi:pyruvate formate lyase activating enzyme